MNPTSPDYPEPYQAEESQEEPLNRENFFLAVAHDLRSPLTAIRSNSEMILRHPEKVERNILLASRIVATSDRLDRMITNLLDASRLRAGKMISLEMARVDLVSLLTEALHNLASIHGDRFVLDIAEPIHGVWCSDAVVRIVENLVTNAVKYGDRSAHITVRATRTPQGVDIAVHNSGNPIRLDEQASLFRLFRRTGDAEEGTQKGWGIGLILVKGLVHAHGGTIRMRSDPQSGTTFTLSLPLDSREAQNRNLGTK